MEVNNNKELESQLYFNWIDDVCLKSQLTNSVLKSKECRVESQKDLSVILNISLTKIKEIEKGVCKDFNAINNYINYLGHSLVSENETYY